MTDKINVTNNHDGVLNVAGVDLRPGATTAVDAKAFDTWKLGNAASIWLEQELITTGAKSGSKVKEPKPADPPAKTEAGGKVDRAAYLAKAKELDLGLKANVSNADLVKAVDEAEAKKALESGNGGGGDGIERDPNTGAQDGE